MKNSHSMMLTELIAQLSRLHATYGECRVWLDQDTSGWLATVALDDDGDVTLYGNTAVDS